MNTEIRHKRIRPEVKRAMIMTLLDDMARDYNKGKLYQMMYSASEIAEKLGYARGSSVRDALYALVDDGMVHMNTYKGKGVVFSECLFASKITVGLMAQERMGI